MEEQECSGSLASLKLGSPTMDRRRRSGQRRGVHQRPSYVRCAVVVTYVGVVVVVMPIEYVDCVDAFDRMTMVVVISCIPRCTGSVAGISAPPSEAHQPEAIRCGCGPQDQGGHQHCS